MSKFIKKIRETISNLINRKEPENDKSNSMIYEDNSVKDMDKENLNEFTNKISNLYNDFSLRINPENWEEVITSQIANKIGKDKVSHELLRFLMDKSNLPYEVWSLFDKYFEWTNKSKELCEFLPQKFVGFVLSNINNEYPFDYYLFKEDINISYDDFIDLYYGAYFALENKNMYAAKKFILEAKNIFSEHLDLIVLEGKYYSEINYVENAIERLSYVINSDDKRFNAYLNRGKVYVRIGELEKAYKDYCKCLKLQPDNTNVKVVYANCCFNMGNYEEAKVIYKELLDEYPYYEEIISNLNSVNHFLIDKIEGKLSAGECSYLDKFNLAQSYFYFNDYEKCYSLVQNIEDSIQPTDELYLLLGDTLRNLDKNNEALDYYDKGIKLSSNNWKIYYGKGLLLQKLNRYIKAIECFDLVINLKPNYGKSYLNKGICLKLLNKNEEAVEYFDKAINIDNQNWQSYTSKGECLIKLGKYDDSVQYFDKAIELVEDNPEPYYMKAVALHLLENYKEAMRYYNYSYDFKNEDTMDYNSLYVKCLYNSGLALYSMGNYKEAYECFDRTIEEESSFIPSYGGKLLVLSKDKDYDECINVCALALRADNINIDKCSNENIIKKFEDTFNKYALELDIKGMNEEIYKVINELSDYAKRGC